jgi:hypothetical protein
MTDDGIGACGNDFLALFDLYGSRQVAVFPHDKKYYHIAQEHNRIGSQNQIDRDMRPLIAKIKARQQETGQNKKAGEFVENVLFPFLLLHAHSSLKKPGIFFQKVEYDRKHGRKQNAHIDPRFPESEGSGGKKKYESKYQGEEAES